MTNSGRTLSELVEDRAYLVRELAEVEDKIVRYQGYAAQHAQEIAEIDQMLERHVGS